MSFCAVCYDEGLSRNQRCSLNVLLISTYELGHQPFGLASPAAWLERAGMKVECLDLSRETLRPSAVEPADFIAFYLPMHTATRLAVKMLPRVRQLNPSAHLCFYGLYAPLNAGYLRSLGAQTIIGGEFEDALVQAAEKIRSGLAAGEQILHSSEASTQVSLARLDFIPPRRDGLPALGRYARLQLPDGTSRVVGYTEASRGCKHLCRHCPVVPVYNGRFRIVQQAVVMEDIRRQVEAGAQHITFGDPDFFNGIRHALSIVTGLHRAFPTITYDATIKVEHLLKHAERLPMLRETGCLFVTTAVESVDGSILSRLEKGHTYADFRRVAGLFREVGLILSPTFVAFTPWTTVSGYAKLLDAIADLDLIGHVASVQLGIRLLIPSGSRLLELDEMKRLVGPFDESNLIYPWRFNDSQLEELYTRVQSVIRNGIKKKESRQMIFNQLRALAARAAGDAIKDKPEQPRSAIPYLTEAWYCCAEPTGDELVGAGEPQV